MPFQKVADITSMGDATAAFLASNTGSQFRQALDEIYMQGTPGRKTQMVAGVVRNSGSGWTLIEDSNHKAMNIDSVDNDTGFVNINYPSLGAKKMIGYIAACDETMTGNGFAVGARVTQNQARILISRTNPFSDRIYYDNSSSSFKTDSSTSPFTPGTLSGSTGALMITHENLGSRFRDVSISSRGITYDVILSSQPAAIANVQTQVEFINRATGVRATTPDASMQFYLSRGGGGAMDPNLVVSTSGNIWFMGIFEV